MSELIKMALEMEFEPWKIKLVDAVKEYEDEWGGQHRNARIDDIYDIPEKHLEEFWIDYLPWETECAMDWMREEFDRIFPYLAYSKNTKTKTLFFFFNNRKTVVFQPAKYNNDDFFSSDGMYRLDEFNWESEEDFVVESWHPVTGSRTGFDEDAISELNTEIHVDGCHEAWKEALNELRLYTEATAWCNQFIAEWCKNVVSGFLEWIAEREEEEAREEKKERILARFEAQHVLPGLEKAIVEACK